MTSVLHCFAQTISLEAWAYFQWSPCTPLSRRLPFPCYLVFHVLILAGLSPFEKKKKEKKSRLFRFLSIVADPKTKIHFTVYSHPSFSNAPLFSSAYKYIYLITIWHSLSVTFTPTYHILLNHFFLSLFHFILLHPPIICIPRNFYGGSYTYSLLTYVVVICFCLVA